MVGGLLRWLNQPYYFTSSIRFKLNISLKVNIFVFIFLYLFKPFNPPSLYFNYLEYCASISFINYLITIVWLFFPETLLGKSFLENNWTIRINLFYLAFGLVLSGSLCWFYVSHLNPKFGMDNFSYWEFLWYTFLCGFGPITMFIYINEKASRSRRELRAIELSEALVANEDVSEDNVSFASENGKDEVVIDINKLIYITSEGNYACFYVLEKEETIKEIILRTTLTKIETVLENKTQIVRCHRSYIVNANYVTGFSGNARGYLLKFKMLAFEIPVSRKFNSKLLEKHFTNRVPIYP